MGKRVAKSGDADAIKFELKRYWKKLSLTLDEGKLLRSLELDDNEAALIKPVAYMNMLTLKPTMYVANVNDDGFREQSTYLDEVKARTAAESENAPRW